MGPEFVLDLLPDPATSTCPHPLSPHRLIPCVLSVPPASPLLFLTCQAHSPLRARALLFLCPQCSSLQATQTPPSPWASPGHLLKDHFPVCLFLAQSLLTHYVYLIITFFNMFLWPVFPIKTAQGFVCSMLCPQPHECAWYVTRKR